jgi:hypothetical protein
MNLEDILMRIVKIAVAIGAIAFAGLLVLGEFNVVTHHLAETWHQHLGAVLWIALCLCVAWMLLRRPVNPVADVHCPHCRSLGGHKFAPQYRGSINHALFHFGGFLPSIFFSGRKQQRFRCRDCNELFHSHTSVSRGYRLLFLLLAAIIVNSVWNEIAEFVTAGN